MNVQKLFALSTDVPIRPLTLKFLSSVTEQNYQAQLRDESLPLLRLALISAIFAISAFYPADKVLFPNDYEVMWILRTFLMLPAVIIVIGISFLPCFNKYRNILSSFTVLVSGWSMAFGIYWYGEPGLLYFTCGTVIVAIFSYIMLGLPIIYATVTTWIFVLATAIAIISSPSHLALKVGAIHLLLVSYVCLTIAAYRIENLSRRLYYRSLQLIYEQEHARNTEKQRMAWLESMAKFFKHEVNNYISVVRTSLDLISQRANELFRIDPYIKRAKKGIQMIDSIAKNVNNATSIESALRIEPRDMVAVNRLIQEQVEFYQTQYPGCEFLYQSNRRCLAIHGVDNHFKQTLDNLVKNAVDYHMKGTPIIISLTQHQKAFAVLEVINKGPLLPCRPKWYIRFILLLP